MSSPHQRYYPVCSLGQLAHAECLEFTLPAELTHQAADTNPILIEAFALNWQGQYYCYSNSCPHTNVNLNWTANQFFDLDTQYIQCSLHGALFDPQSGLCLRGPCLGESLIALPILIQDGVVSVDLKALNSA